MVIQMKQTFHYKILIVNHSITLEFYLSKPNRTHDQDSDSLTDKSEKRRFSFKLSYDWNQVEESIETIEMLNNEKMVETYIFSKRAIETCNVQH